MREPRWLLVLAGVTLLLTVGCGDDDGGGGPGPGPLAPPAIPDPMHGPITDDDIDGDGIANDRDVCPSVANADQRRACEYPDPPVPTGDVENDAVAHLNWVRTTVGLPGVTEDPMLTRGCQLHVTYLRMLSAELGSPVLSHTEDLSKSYASAEGNSAGINSVLSLGQSNIAEAIDGWMNTLYHRLPLIHPGLARIGVAYEERFACLLYRDGTDARAVAPHPILWPPPDIQSTDKVFGGAESPCPTVADPLGGGRCPGSAAIPTIGLNRMGALSGVTMTFTQLDDSSTVPMFRVYYDGGPSEHERAGYLEGTVAYVPSPGSMLASAPYEVRVDATVGGTAQTYRWRFRTARALPAQDSVGCNDLGPQGTPAMALRVESGERIGKICAPENDYFVLGGSGMRHVTIDYDHDVGDLDVKAYDATMANIATSEGVSGREVLDVPAGTIVEIYGFRGAGGIYVLNVR